MIDAPHVVSRSQPLETQCPSDTMRGALVSGLGNFCFPRTGRAGWVVLSFKVGQPASEPGRSKVIRFLSLSFCFAFDVDNVVANIIVHRL